MVEAGDARMKDAANLQPEAQICAKHTGVASVAVNQAVTSRHEGVQGYAWGMEEATGAAMRRAINRQWEEQVCVSGMEEASAAPTRTATSRLLEAPDYAKGMEGGKDARLRDATSRLEATQGRAKHMVEGRGAKLRGVPWPPRASQGCAAAMGEGSDATKRGAISQPQALMGLGLHFEGLHQFDSRMHVPNESPMLSARSHLHLCPQFYPECSINMLSSAACHPAI